MQRESSGDGRTISPKGALGLMQIMRGIWVEQSFRYGLGIDPPMAGAAYLRGTHDRFGSAGFLGVYHAGPVRYEPHLVTGKPLPSETGAYVAAAPHCRTTSEVNMPELTAGVHFLGGRLP
jgi:soluble lytic murein transglycosylase-like protein